MAKNNKQELVATASNGSEPIPAPIGNPNQQFPAINTDDSNSPNGHMLNEAVPASSPHKASAYEVAQSQLDAVAKLMNLEEDMRQNLRMCQRA